MEPLMEDPAIKAPTKTFRDASPLLDDPEALRAEADEKGYLFLKGIVPLDVITDLRSQILAILDRKGYLDKTRPPIEGFVDREEIHRVLTEKDVNYNGVGVPDDVYLAVQKLESFHALAHEPKLIRLYETLFGERAFPHPRHIARLMLPHDGLKVTPAHQDFLHIQGAEKTWTAWIPLGDATLDMGPLSILEGSHKAGLLGVVNAPGAGGLESILCGMGHEWAAGDYEAGDLVTFHSLTVHRALPSKRKDRIRISADLRYQPASAPIEERSLMPHVPHGWDELYEGWTRQELQYYWRKEHFDFVPFDESIRWQKDKIC